MFLEMRRLSNKLPTPGVGIMQLERMDEAMVAFSRVLAINDEEQDDDICWVCPGPGPILYL